MDRKIRYYEIHLSSAVPTRFHEKIYITVKEDKTISIVKEKSKKSEITLYNGGSELTDREFHEITKNFKDPYNICLEDLESRIERMKE